MGLLLLACLLPVVLLLLCWGLLAATWVLLCCVWVHAWVGCPIAGSLASVRYLRFAATQQYTQPSRCRHMIKGVNECNALNALTSEDTGPLKLWCILL